MTDLSPHASALAVTGPAAQSTEPRDYVACLAAYNNGHLHGAWISATTPDEIRDAVRTMLAASPEPNAEEWVIHDYEGFEGANLSEYASFETVCGIADFVREHGELGATLLHYFGGELEEARAAFEDYAGEYRSAAEFAEQLHDDIGTQIPASLQYYVDWSALARDMELNGDIMTVETGFDQVHVFWCH